ncbi:hypothetical protein SCP_1701930 [Sparassis crispa]|uniref:Uncharacterized protein n=1 Tax=Sparassis crispa TaxID=139825 RepID=A0A401H601_9APHY|nr:hypothetical protein SCP_1701930 [Sparassis crispa]GBE89867.1 hypothetical protein SCP_1701930 [Sparassis crispa]
MVQHGVAPTPRKKSKGGQKLTINFLPSYASLNKLSKAKVDAWFRAESTSDGYKQYVREGKAWIAKWAESMKGSDGTSMDALDSSAIAVAFDTVSEYTPKALHAFVIYKCEIQENSYKTAEGIRSAFKHYFTYTHLCQGNFWRKNGTTGQWEGNPVFDLSYSSFHESLKKEYQRSSDSSHSLPMLSKNIEKMFAYADHACSSKKISKTQQLFWKAFVSIAFTLWTRCDEAINLTAGDTNQDNPEKSNNYDIPLDSTIPHLDCYMHTINWMNHLAEQMQHPLQKTDFIFPALASTGKLKIGTAVGHAEIKKLLEHFVSGIELLAVWPGKFTTHCFRCGGAQWCFMWCPDRKWSLKAVKWQGGWSPTESVHLEVTTLTRYLLDEVCKYEHGYSDMVMPSRSFEHHVTFMGDDAVHQSGLAMASSDSMTLILEEIRAKRVEIARIVSSFQPSQVLTTPGHVHHLGPNTNPLSWTPSAPLITDAFLGLSESGPGSRAVLHSDTVTDIHHHQKGLLLPLKEWPKHFKPSQYRSEAVKWGKIQKVVDKYYTAYGSNRQTFDQLYPGLSTKYTQLVRAINAT